MYLQARLRKAVVLLLGLLFLATIEIPSGLHTALAVDLSTAIIEVAKKNLPAVVYVEVTGTQEVANPFMPFENDPFFRRFFDPRASRLLRPRCL